MSHIILFSIYENMLVFPMSKFKSSFWNKINCYIHCECSNISKYNSYIYSILALYDVFRKNVVVLYLVMVKCLLGTHNEGILLLKYSYLPLIYFAFLFNDYKVFAIILFTCCTCL